MSERSDGPSKVIDGKKEKHKSKLDVVHRDDDDDEG